MRALTYRAVVVAIVVLAFPIATDHAESALESKPPPCSPPPPFTTFFVIEDYLGMTSHTHEQRSLHFSEQYHH